MKTVHSNRHRSHNGQTELANGKILPGNDSPERAERILAALEHHAIGPVIEPQRHDLASIQRIHPAGYLSFLQGVWPRWRDEGHTGPAMASVWHTDNFPRERNSTSIVAALGQHSFDGAASIVEGTFDAAAASIDVALTSADLLINGDRAAFALCRPPGHHAGAAYMGGYCYLNNAAAAAQRFLENARASRISILDVDYHHGNGTQDIFYHRADVQVLSLHGDPSGEYPYFSGFTDETGAREGQGYNFNAPLPPGTDWDAWRNAFDLASQHIDRYGPDVLIVSLGVDTYESDPIGRFLLKSEDFLSLGKRIAGLNRPTLFVMEGGYATDAIGTNVANVLRGFLGG